MLILSYLCIYLIIYFIYFRYLTYVYYVTMFFFSFSLCSLGVLIFSFYFFYSGKNPWWTPLHPRHSPNRDAGFGLVPDSEVAPCCAANILAKKPTPTRPFSEGARI